MTKNPPSADNIFLNGSLPFLFLKTAVPIITVMAVNGFFTVVDAYFLGEYVGAEALTAVTLMFPLYILLVALSTLVSNGFSSVFARLLGAGERYRANVVFVQAIQLSIVVCGFLIALFYFTGDTLTLWVANESIDLAGMGYTYISILILFSPLVFVLAINIDALRGRGFLRAMAAITMTSACLNIFFDYLFIVEFGWGVAGSAYGTVLAQLCALLALLYRRLLVNPDAAMKVSFLTPGYHHWREFLVLGAPTSLGYMGVSLMAAMILLCLRLWADESYEATAGAYGIITRLMTFTFLPLLGLSLAFQSIVGNNYGAKDWHRSNGSVKLALASALIYCLVVETTFILTRSEIGFVFVDDPMIAAEISRIMPFAVSLMFVFGPMVMLATYFQAIGDATRAALLGLSRTYLFALPLTFLLPFWLGESGIWYAGIVAEALVLILAISVLSRRRRSHGQGWGLFEPVA